MITMLVTTISIIQDLSKLQLVVERITTLLQQLPEFVMIIAEDSELLDEASSVDITDQIPWFLSTPGGRIVSAGVSWIIVSTMR